MTKFVLFLLTYSFTKIIRVMAAATVPMAAAFLLCKVGGCRTRRLNLGVLLLVPCSCLLGYSRIFFTGKCYLFTNWIQGIVTEEMAVCYFGIAGLLAVRHLYGHRRLHKKIVRLPQARQEECPAFLNDMQGIGAKRKIRVYITEDNCSPFAGGIRKPYIVMPRILLRSLSKEESEAVFYHEMLHIRQGHLLLLKVYAWLKILWWVHPAIYLLDCKLRENMEYCTDEGSVLLGSLNAQEYAAVILKTIRVSRQPVLYHMAFSNVRSALCFETLKKRLEGLSNIKKDGGAKLGYQKKRRQSALLSATAALILTATIGATSLPRYTRIKEISVYDDNLHPLTFDLQKEGFRADTTDGIFSISGQELSRFAGKYRLRGQYVIFGFDTIMKVPGVGGFGKVVRVSLADASDVEQLWCWDWMDCLKIFILKYLV